LEIWRRMKKVSAHNQLHTRTMLHLLQMIVNHGVQGPPYQHSRTRLRVAPYRSTVCWEVVQVNYRQVHIGVDILNLMQMSFQLRETTSISAQVKTASIVLLLFKVSTHITIWASPFGPHHLGLTIWASPFGPHHLGLTIWASPFIHHTNYSYRLSWSKSCACMYDVW
jgi:hypothetical protein